MLLALAFPFDELRRVDTRAALDILLIAVLLYYILNLLRGTRAVQISVAVLLFLAAFYGARWARLEMVEWLLSRLVPYLAIALIVLFQPEIRRGLARLGSNPLWRRFSSQSPAGVQDDVVLAATHFSHHRIGALIVLERKRACAPTSKAASRSTRRSATTCCWPSSTRSRRCTTAPRSSRATAWLRRPASCRFR